MRYVKIVLVAVLIWLVPFALSNLFIMPNGSLSAPFLPFKLTMISALVATSALAFGWLWRTSDDATAAEALAVGAVAMLINVLLDMLTVIPTVRMSAMDYVAQIGWLYLLIPLTSWVMQQRQLRGIKAAAR